MKCFVVGLTVAGFVWLATVSWYNTSNMMYGRPVELTRVNKSGCDDTDWLCLVAWANQKQHNRKHKQP